MAISVSPFRSNVHERPGDRLIEVRQALQRIEQILVAMGAATAADADLTTHIGDKANPHEVSPAQVGQRTHAFGKTAAPTANDDTGDGYQTGSLWVDETADKAYICQDSTEGAAIWKQINLPIAGESVAYVLAQDGAGGWETHPVACVIFSVFVQDDWDTWIKQGALMVAGDTVGTVNPVPPPTVDGHILTANTALGAKMEWAAPVVPESIVLFGGAESVEVSG